MLEQQKAEKGAKRLASRQADEDRARQLKPCNGMLEVWAGQLCLKMEWFFAICTSANQTHRHHHHCLSLATANECSVDLHI